MQDIPTDLWQIISIHALLAESDAAKESWKTPHINFYPRSPCGERPVRSDIEHHHGLISIHALLAESDRHHRVRVYLASHFYPRSPCGERRSLSVF